MGEHDVLKVADGVSYDREQDSFLFKFESENETAVLKRQIHRINAFGRCFCYAYEFDSNVDSHVRTKFIHQIKFKENFLHSEECDRFIGSAIKSLDDELCVPSFDVFVYPESMSELNRRMLIKMILLCLALSATNGLSN